MWKESVTVFHRILLKGLRKTTKSISRYSRIRSRGANHMTGVLCCSNFPLTLIVGRIITIVLAVWSEVLYVLSERSCLFIMQHLLHVSAEL
jgi:hypothetical protein